MRVNTAVRIRYLIEFILVRSMLLVIDVISIRAAEAFAVSVARLSFRLDKRRKNTAIENILTAGITDSRAEAEIIALKSFQNFAVLVIDSIKFNDIIKETPINSLVHSTIPEETMELMKDGKTPVILVSGHLGNWEVAGRYVSQFKPVTGVTKNMHNPMTNNLMKKRKTAENFTLTPMRDANAARFLGALKGSSIFALLIDQHARKSRGMMIPFFGKPASTHTSAALLHLITKAPIVFGYCIRKGPSLFEVIASEPIIHKRTGNREADVRAIVENINHRLEDAVRQYPEQYLWAHRRWR